jgi:hypothetical protein
MLLFSDRVTNYLNNNDLSKLKYQLLLYRKTADHYAAALDISDDLITSKSLQISRQLDVKDYATWQASTLTLTLQNKHNQYFQNKQNGYFTDGNYVYDSKIELYFYIDGFPEDNYILFTGYILEAPKYRPDESVVEIRLADSIKKLQNISAENLCNVYTDEQLTASDQSQLIFKTQNNYVGFIDILKKGADLSTATTLTEGVDFTVSELDESLPAQIELRSSLPAGQYLWATYRQWKQNLKIGEIITQVLDSASFPIEKRDIAPIVFENDVEIAVQPTSKCLFGINATSPYTLQPSGRFDNSLYFNSSLGNVIIINNEIKKVYFDSLLYGNTNDSVKVWWQVGEQRYNSANVGIFTSGTLEYGFYISSPSWVNPSYKWRHVAWQKLPEGYSEPLGDVYSNSPNVSISINSSSINFNCDDAGVPFATAPNPGLYNYIWGAVTYYTSAPSNVINISNIHSMNTFKDKIYETPALGNNEYPPFADFYFQVEDDMTSLSRIDIPLLYPQTSSDVVRIATSPELSGDWTTGLTDYVPNSSLVGNTSKSIFLRYKLNKESLPALGTSLFNSPTLYYLKTTDVSINTVNVKGLNIYNVLQTFSVWTSYGLGIKNEGTIFLKPNEQFGYPQEISDDKIIKIDAIVDLIPNRRNKVSMESQNYTYSLEDDADSAIYGNQEYKIPSSSLLADGNINIPIAIVPTVLNNLNKILTEFQITMILDLSLELNDYIKIWHNPNPLNTSQYSDLTKYLESYTYGIYGFIAKLQNDLKNKTTKISLIVDLNNQTAPSGTAKTFKYDIKSSFDNEI